MSRKRADAVVNDLTDIGYSRREALRIMGVSGVGLLAGCSTDSETDTVAGDDTGSPGTSGAEPVDGELTAIDRGNPEEFQFNPFYAKKASARYRMLWEPLMGSALYTRALDKKPAERDPVVEIIADDWSVDGKTFTLTLREDYEWHNGDDLVAEDVLTYFTILEGLGRNAATNFEEITAVDTYTVEFTAASPINGPIFIRNALSGKLGSNRNVFAEWRQQFEDATTDEERKSVAKELRSHKIDEPVGNSVWKWKEASGSDRVYTVHDGHPQADEIDYDLRVEFADQNEQWYQALIADKIDWTNGIVGARYQGQYPSNVDGVSYSTASGDVFLFNLRKEKYQNRHLRRAIAFALDFDLVARSARTSYSIPNYLTEMITPQNKKWVGDIEDSLTSYKEPQPEKAAAELQKAGYVKEDGTWISDDTGEPLTLPFVNPSNGTWGLNSQSAVGQLQQMGLEASANITDWSSFTNQVNNRDWEIMTWAPGHYDPFYYSNFNGALGGYEATVGPDKAKELAAFEVPMPVGDPSGSLETIELTSVLDEMRNATSESETRDVVRKAAWMFNQSVPRIYHLSIDQWTWPTRDDWNLPAKNSEEFVRTTNFNHLSTLSAKGRIRAKTK